MSQTLEFFEEEQEIKQLEKRRGGYFYVSINAEIVNQFENKRSTRLICTLNGGVRFRCGLNHLGDGNFFIIISTKNLNSINKQLGEKILFKVEIDPDQLGVEVPELLTELLKQDDHLTKIYKSISNGKKRSLIHSLKPIKNIDKQIEHVSNYLLNQKLKKN